MAWKPWYERVADMGSAREQEQFLRGVFGDPNPPSDRKLIGMAAMTVAVGAWAVHQTRKKKKR